MSALLLHTPGPWALYEGTTPGGDYGATLAGPDGWQLAVLAFPVSETRYPANRPRDHANARLIAAAPELLDALRDLIDLARAAMQEAQRDGADYDIDAELAEARAAIAKATKGA